MNPVDEEERLQRHWQEKEAAWAAVEKELWWLFELPEEVWPRGRRRNHDPRGDDDTDPEGSGAQAS